MAQTGIPEGIVSAQPGPGAAVALLRAVRTGRGRQQGARPAHPRRAAAQAHPIYFAS